MKLSALCWNTTKTSIFWSCGTGPPVFKDMALQILPYFLTTSLKKSGGEKEAVILTATSGDTGKAALEGFKDVPGTRILVFYPGMVSVLPKRNRWSHRRGQCLCVRY